MSDRNAIDHGNPDRSEGHEAQPDDAAEVEESADRADRLESHHRPAGDDQAVSDAPSRGGSPGSAPSW